MTVQIHSTAVVEEGAELGNNVIVGPYSLVGSNVKIGNDCTLKGHVNISGHTTIGESNTFYTYSTIGTEPQDIGYKGEPTRLEIGNNNHFREFVSVNRGTTKDQQITKIGNNNMLMAYAHIGHDAIVEDNCVIVNNVNLAGHVHLGSKCIIGGGSNISQFVTVGRGAYIGGASAVDRDIPHYCTAYGNRVILKGINIVGLRRQGFSKQEISELVDFYRNMEASALSSRAYVKNEESMSEYKGNVLVEDIAEFIIKSDIGIAPFVS